MMKWKMLLALVLAACIPTPSDAVNCREPNGVYRCFDPKSDWEGGPIFKQRADCSTTTEINHCCVDTDNGAMCCGNGVACVNPDTSSFGDITDVFGCTTGNCSALVGGSGDSFSMADADFAIPCVIRASCASTINVGRCCIDSDIPGAGPCWGNGSACVFTAATSTTTTTTTTAGSTTTTTLGAPPDAFFVDPVSGDDGAAGSQAAPWKTAKFAVGGSSALGDNDALWLRGGTYNETQIDTADAIDNVTVRAFPGETPLIDGSYVDFRTVPNTEWTLVGPGNVYESVDTFAQIQSGGFFDSGGGVLKLLIDYQSMANLTNTKHFWDATSYYAGPGTFYNSGNQKIYVRLDPPTVAAVGVDYYTGWSLNPNNTPLYIEKRCPGSCFGWNISSGGWTLDGIHFRAHGPNTIQNDQTINGLTLTNLDIQQVGAGAIVFTNLSQNATITNNVINGNIPPWLAWEDFKETPFVATSAEVNGITITVGSHHVTASGNTILYANDAFKISGTGSDDPPGCGSATPHNTHHISILNNTIAFNRDDGISLGSDGHGHVIAGNQFLDVAQMFALTGEGQSDVVGDIYIHHNVGRVVDSFLARPRAVGQPFVPGGGPNACQFPIGSDWCWWYHQAFGGHAVSCAGESPWKVYNNTVIHEGLPVNDGTMGYNYEGKVVQGSPGVTNKHEVLNNIFVFEIDNPMTKLTKVGTGQEVYDGNLYWRGVNPATNIHNPMWLNFTDPAQIRAFHDIPAFRANACSSCENCGPGCCASCATDWFTLSKTYYAPGWDNSSIEADPDLDANFVPAFGSPANSGAVDLAGRGWPGFDGLPYRGAKPPAGVTTTTTTTLATTTTTATLPDWSASFIAVWNLDEASGTRAASGGSCAAGSDCDLTDVDTVGSDATEKIEGARSALFTGGGTESLECADATCDELDFTSSGGLGGDYTILEWARCNSTSSDINLVENGVLSGLSTPNGPGYLIQRISTSNRHQAYTNDGSTTLSTGSPPDSMPVDTWTHLGVRFNDTSNLYEALLNGTTSGAPISVTTAVPGTADFKLFVGGSVPPGVSCRVDELAIDNAALTNAQICRICSCRIAGTACKCGGDGTVYAVSGDNATRCGSCTLPACNAAAP